MAWYIWVLVVWAAGMGAVSASGFFPLKDVAKNYAVVNDFFGCLLTLLIFFGCYRVVFVFDNKVLALLVGLASLSLIVSVLQSVKDNDPETEEKKQELGQTVIKSLQASREAGADPLAAGIEAVAAAHEKKSDRKYEFLTALALLLPNLVAIYIGARVLSGA